MSVHSSYSYHFSTLSGTTTHSGPVSFFYAFSLPPFPIFSNIRALYSHIISSYRLLSLLHYSLNRHHQGWLCPAKVSSTKAQRRLPLVSVRSVASPEEKEKDGLASSTSRAIGQIDRDHPPDEVRPLEPVTGRELNLVFVDESTGERIGVMPADYGFRSGTGRLYQDGYGEVPTSVVDLATENFRKELLALRQSVRFDSFPQTYGASEGADKKTKGSVSGSIGSAVRSTLAKLDNWLEDNNLLPELKLPRDAREPDLTPMQQDIINRVNALELDDDAVLRRERQREKEDGPIEAPLVVRFAFRSLCWLLDVIYGGRPIQRFWVLETVARMPYFAFISMLHLYESLGWWRAGADLRKVHFAEEINELHHLQIMESLGGDALWADRFLAQHAAVFYYWILIVMYLVSPSASYAFSELVEFHAVDTYSEFLEQNKELLESIPPPLVALNYYKSGDLYLFDQLQTAWPAQEPRRPPCASLHDVFVNIRNDELEHCRTMLACKNGSIAEHIHAKAATLSGSLVSETEDSTEEQ